MNLNLSENAASLNLWMQPERPDEFWATLFDQMPYCLVVFDREGRILLANDEAVRRLNLTDTGDFILPEYLKPLQARPFHLELRDSRPLAVTIPSPADGHPLTFQLRHLPF